MTAPVDTCRPCLRVSHMYEDSYRATRVFISISRDAARGKKQMRPLTVCHSILSCVSHSFLLCAESAS